jgi:polyphosphate glucokinase
VNVLVIDVGGTHVKILASGQKAMREFPSGPTLTPKRMVAGVKKLAGEWKYDAVSIGYPGPVVRIARLPNRITSGVAGWDLTLRLRSNDRLKS